MLLLAAVGLTAYAETKFSVVPPKGAEAGRNFNVIYRLENATANEPKIGEILGCRFIYGPSRSTSQSIVFNNGHQTSTSTVEYSYTYKTDSAGVYTIPAASISVNGKLFKTEPVKFEVFPSNRPSGGNTGQQQGGNFAPLKSGSAISKDDVFIRMIPSKTTVYEQEPIECTIKLYTKYRQIQSFKAVSQPNFDGCIIEELPVSPSLDNVEQYNGQTYSTAVLKKVVIFPQKSGKLKLNSGKYDITVMQYERLNSFFGPQLYPVGEEEIHVNPGDLTINVTPLPPFSGDGFTGAVGDFTVQGKLSNDHLRTNEAATLTYTIKGTGNIKYLKEPSVELPAEFEQYTPKVETDAHLTGANTTGTMTVEYTFVPQAPGEFTIPGSEFTYFNPASRSYKTLPIPSFKISVARGAGTTTTVATEQMKINAGMTDILHIKTGVNDLKKNHTLIVYSWVYWLVAALLFIVFFAAVIGHIKHQHRLSDVTGLRLAKAAKVAKRHLKKANQTLKTGNSELFYQDMLKAVWGYLSDKLGIAASQLNRGNVSASMTERGVPQELIDRIVNILDECEMAQYTPQSMSAEAKEQMLKETEATMEAIEKVK